MKIKRRINKIFTSFGECFVEVLKSTVEMNSTSKEVSRQFGETC